jgi:TRAP-type transport system small permease protein
LQLVKIYRPIEHVLLLISKVINNIGVSVMILLVILILVDVTLRYLFNNPIRSVYEIVAIMVVIIVSFSMAYSGITRSLVSIEIIIERFPAKVQNVLAIFQSIMGLAFFSLLCWKTMEQSIIYWNVGSKTYAANLPLFPFILILSFGSGLLSLVFLIQLIRTIDEVSK